MSAAFTKGPWIFHEPYAGFSKITDADDNLIFGIARGFDDEAQTDEICEANAHLIAAAPNLYARLNHAAENGDRYDGNDWAAFVQEARAECAKARGEQP